MTVSPLTSTSTPDTASTPPPGPEELSVLRPFQGLWRGLVFGEGTPFDLVENVNLLEYESRIADQPIPQGDGDIVYGRWASGRFITLSFVIGGTPLSLELDENVQTWQAAWATDDPYRQEWLAFETGFRTLLIRARVARRRVELSSLSTRSGMTTAVVELKVSDPRVYIVGPGGQAVRSVFISTVAPSGGGFDLAADLPLDMTASSGSSTVAVNNGSGIAYPTIRVSNAGPENLTSVTITNVTTGVSVQVDTTVLPGQVLVLDFDGLMRATTGPHVHIDGSSRYGDWVHPRTPLGLDPGPNVLTATHTGGTPTIRADWMESIL